MLMGQKLLHIALNLAPSVRKDLSTSRQEVANEATSFFRKGIMIWKVMAWLFVFRANGPDSDRPRTLAINKYRHMHYPVHVNRSVHINDLFPVFCVGPAL
jgi:hypothetical protein